MATDADDSKQNWTEQFGPGLITGAADDDPSGIATYSQAGAQFGLNMLWTVVLTFPLMAGIQGVAARIGRVTGEGLAANIKRIFPRWVLSLLVILLLVANTINIAADIAAMGEAAALVLPAAARELYAVAFGVLSLVLEVVLSYKRYVRILKWLTLALLAYVAVVFSVHVPWDQVAVHTLLPRFALTAASMTMVVAVFGTTISPYLFFWQSSQEVEELGPDAVHLSLLCKPEPAKRELRRLGIDTWSGMGFSNLIAFFIILTTAVTLNAAGVTNIQTAAQAALALKPIAGNFAFALFSLGIIGTGLLAVPVLAGSAAYAVTEARGWPHGLDRKLKQARGFYAIIAIATLGGVALGFTPIDPIKALFWSAVVNGVVAVPIMAVSMIVATRKSLMGAFTATRLQRVLGWAATGVMALAAVGMFIH